jgi:hypothetical protein
MRRRFARAICLIAMLTIPLSGSAAEGTGWKMPNLNPFAAKRRAAAHVSDSPTSGFHFPKLWPASGSAKKSLITKGQPSSWQRMTSGTKKFFSKTADAVNPWDDKPQPTKSITGSNSVFTNNAAPKEPKSGSILPASWWTEEKQSDKPKSVNEFLARPRPQ